jgi:hypothetical protein
VEGLERGGRERRFSLGAGLSDRQAGVAETIAHLRGPEFVVELNEGFQFAQVMGVAERMEMASRRARETGSGEGEASLKPPGRGNRGAEGRLRPSLEPAG